MMDAAPQSPARRPIRLLGLLCAGAVAAALAGCGGSSSTTTTSTSTSTPAPASQAAAPAATAPAAHIAVRHTRRGRILVDASGRTLYVLSADHHGHSACSAACLRFWPAVTSGPGPTGGPGVKASLLGITQGSGGVTIVTYHGHPLYRFALDAHPGQTKGEERHAFGGRWDVVSPAGSAIRPAPPKPKPAVAAVQPAPLATMSSTATVQSTQAPVPTTTRAAPITTTHTVAPPVTRTTHTASPPPPSGGGIPQGGGGDGDADNSGGPSDGDGNV